VGIIVDVGRLPAPAWAPYAAERWARPLLVAPRLISLPTSPPPRGKALARPAGEPSRMVAIARVLAIWRAAERALASLQAGDPRRDQAEAAVATSRADYHRLFAEHQARLPIG